MKDKQYYTDALRDFPEVLNIEQFREIIGSVGINSTRLIITCNHVKSYRIRDTYFVPKEYAIDYLLSEQYADDAKCMKIKRPI